MIYTKASRKRNSRAILDKADNLDQEVSNYQSRVSGLVDKVNNDGEDDVANRENLLEYIHLYLDTFNEMKYLGHYKLAENKVSPFISISNIKLSSYFPSWEDDEIELEDCKYLWSVFLKYSSARSDTINASNLWDNTDLRANTQKKAIPNTPSISEFQNCIVKLDSKPYVVASDIFEECSKINSVLISNGNIKTHDYSYIVYKDQMSITPSGTKISYSSFNDKASYGYSTYNVVTNDSGKTESYASKLVNGEFKVGQIHFYCSDDLSTFGFAKVVGSRVKVERVSIKSEYLVPPETATESFQELCFESSDVYWNCNYYADIDFEFTYINGSSTMKPYGDITEDLVIKIMKTYHGNLSSLLNEAYSNYKNSLEIIRTDDNGKYDEYLNYLNSADYSSLSSSITINNTVVNSIKSWGEIRISELYNTIRDEVAADTVKSIISERMNKNYGTLYGWYANELIPLSDAYNEYVQKINNGLYIFKTMLVAPNLNLDYTLEENGGAEITEPNYFDIAKDRISYYKKAGISTDFKAGDTVYIMDDNNTEITGKILEIKQWSGKDGSDDITVKRLILDCTIPDIYDYSTLRVVKLF